MDSKILKKIVEGAPDPIIIQSGGQFAWLNPAACRLFDVKTSRDLTGTLFTDSIHPDHREVVSEMICRLNEEQKPVNLMEYKVVCRDGSEVWVESKGEAIEYEGKGGGLVFMRDISSRKEAEQAFLQNEEIIKSSYTLLRMAGEIAQFGGWSVDVSGNPDDLGKQTVKWSAAVAGIHGTPPGYFPLVRDAINFYAPRWRKKITRVFTRCVQNGIPFDEEMEIIPVNGKKVWIRTIGEAVLEDGKIVRVQGALQDITRIRKVEQEIKASEEKFRNIFHNHSAVKLIIDPDNGNIIDANRAASRFYGWTAEEMGKMNISDINTLKPEEIKKEMDRARRLEDVHFNFRHRRADGTVRDVEVFSSKVDIGSREFLHSIVHDVTGKKIAERQLQLLSRSVEQSPVSIVITDTDGKIEYVNPVFETTTGYTLEEIKGKGLSFLKSGYHSREFYETLWNTILSGKEWKGEFRNKNRNGELYWIHTVISPILNNRGKVTNFVSVMEDITENKRMIEELVAAKEKAEESNRLKSAFLANISHEIRTPMNGIMGFAEILKTPDLSRQNQLKFYEVIEKSGMRMLDTVNDLIDISEIETGQVKLHISEVNLNEQLENLYDFFLSQSEQKGLELVLKDRVADGCSLVKTDRAKLNSIVTNFIKNAIKFTCKGKIEFGCTRKGNFLEFYVSDTGIGIPPDRHQAIFNRFEQADREDVKAYQGTGLGLSLSKSYAEMLGGEILMESEVGMGSTFRFIIPLKKVQAGNGRKQKRKVVQGNGVPKLEGKKVLIAEDDIFSLQMLSFQLKKTGVSLVVARDGKEAVEEFRKNCVDLVMLDIQMPEMNGYEVLKELRASSLEIPFIAQTAYAMPEDLKRFSRAGFTDYLTKPIGQDKLFRMLNKYLSP